ncbi:MAG: nucleotidyltransferase domain-containing protein [Myxococcota bacterium]
MAKLRQCAQRLLRARADVQEVRLFGSLARGEAHPGSDADLLILLTDSALPPLERTSPLMRYFSGVGLACDIFAYTQSELERLATAGSRFARVVMGEGVILAQRES